MEMRRHQGGFTLIEIVMVLVIVGGIFVGVVGLSGNALQSSQLVVESDRAAEFLHRAQARSIAQEHDDVWGVHFSSSDMTMFKGADFGARDTNFDETYTFPNAISASGLSNVVFDFKTGKTQDTGTITIYSSATNNSVDIQINEAGRINLQ